MKQQILRNIVDNKVKWTSQCMKGKYRWLKLTGQVRIQVSYTKRKKVEVDSGVR